MEARKTTRSLEFTKPVITEQTSQSTQPQSEAQPVCENGVCTISWKPQRPVAA
jgi:hypothetical protein